MKKNQGYISIIIAGLLGLVALVGVGVASQSKIEDLSVGAGSGTISSLPQLIASKDEGSTLVTRTTSLNFVGSGVTATNSGNAVTVTVSGGGTPTAITVADTTDTTSYVGLWTDATGDLGPKTDAGLTYNATTGMLTATGLTGPLTGNASTATALFANGSNCTSGQAPLGVDASGAVESCFDVWTEAENTSAAYLTGNQSITLSGDISGTGATAITTTIGADKVLESMFKAVDAAGDEECLTYESTVGDFEWQTCGGAAGATTALDNLASVAINTTLLSDTDNTDALGTTAIAWSDLFLGSGGVITFNSAPSTADITLTHSADTLTFAGGTIALGTATATGGLTGNVTGNVSGTSATVTGAAQTAITSLGTLTALDIDNININLNTISSTAGTDLLITPLAGQQLILDGTIEIDAGVLTGATSITSTTFVGALTGNASTATALAADPADCSATQFANAIAASGALTCAAIADADVPNTITINLATLATTVTVSDAGEDTTTFPLLAIDATGSLGPRTDAGLSYQGTTNALTATTFIGALTGNSTTATALAGDPADCGANTFADAINASGTLTCNAVVSADITDGTITLADTAITAGRSLTIATNDIGADAELYTDTKCVWFASPTAADDFKSIWMSKIASTITSIWAESDQTVTFMLQVDDGTAADVDSVDLAPAAGTAEDTSLNGDATMAAGDRLDIDLVSVSGTPTWVSICWTFTYDD